MAQEGPGRERQAQSREGAGTSAGGSSSEASRRGTGTFSSSIPGTHPPCFCSFTTSHTHTHADYRGMRSKQQEINCHSVCFLSSHSVVQKCLFFLCHLSQTCCKLVFARDGQSRFKERQNEAEQIDCVPEQLIPACHRVP